MLHLLPLYLIEILVCRKLNLFIRTCCSYLLDASPFSVSPSFS